MNEKLTIQDLVELLVNRHEVSQVRGVKRNAIN